VAQHSRAEAQLLQKHARDARCVVEIGVAEGGSAIELRRVMHQDGTLVLVDPYEPGLLGLSMAWVVARRLVSTEQRGDVRWIRKRSSQAAREWSAPIDFIFIDGDHAYEAAKADWQAWSRYVRVGGIVALHDALPSQWTSPADGPVRLVREIAANDPRWKVVDGADSTAVLRHVGASPSRQESG
jgi:predicted O-methyltransferase YrrM